MNKERKRVDWIGHLRPSNHIPAVKFYKKREIALSKVPEVEREFIWDWCQKRNLDDIFAVVALTYWIRARAEVAVDFLVKPENKKLYMVLCTHISLKWLGYDEEYKCDFYKDLVEVSADVSACTHRQMEIDMLRALNWEL